jgi:hypothetical protein
MVASLSRTRIPGAIAVAALLALVGTAVAAAGNGGTELASVRKATVQFHDVGAAVAAGYGELRDAAGIACIDNPGTGTMGIHYVSSRVGDAVLEPAAPEALVYEPEANGRLRLVALEYIVFKDIWEGEHGVGAAPPRLFGHELRLVPTPNRFGLGAFYQIHAWVWRNNPSGMFFEWNPSVDC